MVSEASQASKNGDDEMRQSRSELGRTTTKSFRSFRERDKKCTDDVEGNMILGGGRMRGEMTYGVEKLVGEGLVRSVSE